MPEPPTMSQKGWCKKMQFILKETMSSCKAGETSDPYKVQTGGKAKSLSLSVQTTKKHLGLKYILHTAERAEVSMTVLAHISARQRAPSFRVTSQLVSAGRRCLAAGAGTMGCGFSSASRSLEAAPSPAPQPRHHSPSTVTPALRSSPPGQQAQVGAGHILRVLGRGQLLGIALSWDLACSPPGGSPAPSPQDDRPSMASAGGWL